LGDGLDLQRDPRGGGVGDPEESRPDLRVRPDALGHERLVRHADEVVLSACGSAVSRGHRALELTSGAAETTRRLQSPRAWFPENAMARSGMPPRWGSTPAKQR